MAAELSTGRSGGRVDPPELVEAEAEAEEDESPPLLPPRPPPPFLDAVPAVPGRTSRVTSPPSDPKVGRGPDDSMVVSPAP